MAERSEIEWTDATWNPVTGCTKITRLHGLVAEGPITVDAIRFKLANMTAAPFSILDWAIIELLKEREFDVLNPNDKERNAKVLKRLSPTNRIRLHPTSLIPGLSRKR